ncbi:ExbD/TolR family protein [Niabella drilacis]|uniref:Biopolymer transport protein ExbD/TolR n=1 Tax=Niabella drilacis (strain DSM 25811 / CCM 8410 / CCUG 62505 / LMG 26954 / E90) TaxID=1285928 RepID=A0A1G6VIV6_NIADE|nr:biopolymer transporter ExbD [Niabella drilacis]SDD53580.1 Biopolymer transport protein ExbD/TolR [Niabella drilacis]
MAKAKIQKKSTDTDMTPFVDVAFLILSFFIMATKFKPSEPVPIDTPNSVASQVMPDNNAVMMSIDKDNKVYFSVMSKSDLQKGKDIIKEAAKRSGIELTDADLKSYQDGEMIGMPFTKIKGFLALPPAERAKIPQDGIPVKDSATSELVNWIGAAKYVFSGESLKYLVKGDNTSKYPTFGAIIDAMKRNDEQKYNLVTMPQDAPPGTDLYQDRLRGSK